MSIVKFKLDSRQAIKELAATIPAVNQAANLRLNRSALKIRNNAANRLKLHGNIDTGQLRASIKIDGMEDTRSLEREIYADAKQGTWIEFGRKASGIPAPFGPLVRWARRKLGDENAGFAIAKKLATKDLKPKPFLRPSFEEEQQPFVDGMFKDITKGN